MHGLAAVPDVPDASAAPPPNAGSLVVVCGVAGPGLDAVTACLVRHALPYVQAVRFGQELCLARTSPALACVLVEPGPAEWLLSEQVDAPVVVCLGQPDLAMVVDALLRRSRAVVRLCDVPDQLVRVLSLVALGYVAMPGADLDQLAEWLGMRLAERPGGVPTLTPRERDILGSIAIGHTVRQTAAALGIAAKTVENTQARLFRKLGVHNRTSALTIACRLGLIDPDEATGGPASVVERTEPMDGQVA